ncbi:unnamed protein product [Rotaria socialis]|uniref:HAT C-terminal dimerisation domain-containing protein n=1 Tax=Rotaria socialis TaxID=392032 RepID=A0A820KR88_9BILA|nr:unnamed protein product [Rotaria socialis]
MYSSLNGTNTLRSHVNPLNVSKKTKTNIIEACTEFFTLNGRAFDVMRGVGFQNLVQILAELINICEKLTSYYIIVDQWTETHTVTGVALRYVTDDFQLFTFILGCFPHNAASHSAQHLREFVNKVLAEYKLVLDTTKFAVTDNEAKIHSHKQQKLPRKLQNYSETRFAGAIIMLDIFREMYQNLPEVLINSNAMENYNAIEKDLLDDICNFLEPFQDVINDLSKDRQPCRHQVMSHRQCLIEHCYQKETDSTVIMELKSFVARRIKNAWYINDYHRRATILHLKLKDFEFCRDEKERSIDIASNVLQNNNANRSQTSTIATTPKRKSLLTQCFDSKLTNQHQSSNSYQEIENYFNADYSNIPHNDDDLDDIDILSFWQENRHTFPQLAKLPKIICAIPASNIIVELLFFQQ